MGFKYQIVDGSLEWEGLRIGNLVDGKELSWSELRAILITQTRFGTGRPIESRSLEEIKKETESVINGSNSWVNRKAEELKRHEQYINNQGAIIESLEDTVGRQNQQINELRGIQNKGV